MWILRVQALLMAIMLVVPIVFTSVTHWENAKHQIELCDNFPEEEREERESEKDKEKEGLEEYDLRYQNQLSALGGSNSNCLGSNSLFASHSGDVLTPPPEYI